MSPTSLKDRFGQLLTLLRGPTVAARAVSATGWALGGHVVKQGVRMGGNVVLTRLLQPEAFGLMGIVNIVLQGLALFSDIGIQTSVIQSKRGDEPAFLDTAWTVQLIRGTLLALVCALMAWPISLFYAQHRLTAMLAIAGLGAWVSGATPTRVYLLWRDLDQRRIMILEASSQIAGLAVMVGLVVASRSVWALVIGSVVGSAINTLVFSIAVPGHRNRWLLDRGVLDEMSRLGRWILLSSIVSFVAGQADRLVLGRLLSMHDLGVYTVALFLARAVEEGVSLVSHRVLFPLYARYARESPGNVRQRMRRPRVGLLILALPPMCALAAFGDVLVHFLYDTRYAGAGWMMRVLTTGNIVGVVNSTLVMFLLARGDSRGKLIVGVVQVVTLFASMFIGWHIGGLHGFVIGVAIAPTFEYLCTIAVTWRHGAVDLPLEIASLGIAGLLLAAMLFLRYTF